MQEAWQISANQPPAASVIAIDGPVASGKSAVGLKLSRDLGYRLVDTGMIYRALTWLLPIPVGIATYLWWRRRSLVAPGKEAPNPVAIEAA